MPAPRRDCDAAVPVSVTPDGDRRIPPRRDRRAIVDRGRDPHGTDQVGPSADGVTDLRLERPRPLTCFQTDATNRRTIAAADDDTAMPRESQLSPTPRVLRPTALVQCPGPAEEPAARTGKVRSRTRPAAADDAHHRTRYSSMVVATLPIGDVTHSDAVRCERFHAAPDGRPPFSCCAPRRLPRTRTPWRSSARTRRRRGGPPRRPGLTRCSGDLPV